MPVPSAAWTWVCATASEWMAGVNRLEHSGYAVAGPGRHGGMLPVVWLGVALVHLLAGWWLVVQVPTDPPSPAPAAPMAMRVELLPAVAGVVPPPVIPSPPASQPRRLPAAPVPTVTRQPEQEPRPAGPDVTEPVSTVPADGGPAPSPAAPAESGALADIVPPTVNPAWGTRPPTVYPVVSRRLGEQGEVLLGLHVLADGRIAEVEVRRSSGHPRLDRAAMDAARRWRLLPARRDGQPVELWHEWLVAFRLN